MLTQLEKIPSKKKPKNKWIKQQYRLERKRKQKQQLRYINNGRQIMNRYYVEMEHPKGREEYGTFYIYMMAYDTQQIIDMIDGVIVHIERTEQEIT